MFHNKFEEIKNFNVCGKRHNCDKLYVLLEENNEVVKKFFEINDEEFEKENKPVIEIVALKPIDDRIKYGNIMYYEMFVKKYIFDSDDNVDNETLGMPYPFNKESYELDYKTIDYDDLLKMLNEFNNCKCVWFKSNRKAIIKSKLAILKILRPNNFDYVSFNIPRDGITSLKIDYATGKYANFSIKITRDGEDSYIYSIYLNKHYGVLIDNKSKCLFKTHGSYEQLIEFLVKIQNESGRNSDVFYEFIDQCYYVTEAHFY